jgi:hypothetical protein
VATALRAYAKLKAPVFHSLTRSALVSANDICARVTKEFIHSVTTTLRKEIAMDQTTPMGSSLTGSGSRDTPNTNPLGAKVEDAAQAAHQTTDKIADKATAQVDRLSGTAHRVVDSAADAASSATEWASGIPEQAEKVQAQLTEGVSASIRARPIAALAGALFIGYLLGRLGRP